ncbi:ammonia-forming cytochrome c nitrite reductase subunit c552 [Desulfosporosinus youngiae]|uniref:nitrite reductase (cytochrome; ammonia-forming) n=1 Tax=Desulfosporosinus youngiae DSM 17734 TaxID=768710 RepID=H5Y066_9FIRM|nr:ammonia-forming cytochrome c nitrite reductase subunit c552 [Desulfosporosinus youngiae]EHQ92045.1 formate-dependent nitrite reductase, periplasmic cytochrome c552 subunit [Desulfosporosinus youngiae DSM 17734]
MDNKTYSRKHLGIAVVTTTILAAVMFAGAFFFVTHNQEPRREQLGEIAANETDPAVWGNYYPLHYQTYQENFNNTEKPSHFETKPYMKPLYAGLGFANEFNEPRGHVYTLEDIREIDPSRYKTGAACNTCKSSQIPGLIEKYGDKYYTMSFEEINSQLKDPIACLNCHDPKTMELKITQPALIQAFERQGKDITKATRQEMRSLVCAQCHVTYYFKPESKILTFPWDNGIKADEILAYFDEDNFSEWKHPDAGTGLVKVRHAEYETFMGSTHQTAGLACADCHMPYVKIGNTKVSSHNWTSPLKTIDQSCAVCHREGSEWLTARVKDTQEKTKEVQDLAGEAVVQAINELKTAGETPGVNAELLAQAQEMHRKGQWYLDYVMVTNGYGFHNPAESLNNLGKAIDYAHQARQLAKDARVKTSE